VLVHAGGPLRRPVPPRPPPPPRRLRRPRRCPRGEGGGAATPASPLPPGHVGAPRTPSPWSTPLPQGCRMKGGIATGANIRSSPPASHARSHTGLRPHTPSGTHHRTPAHDPHPHPHPIPPPPRMGTQLRAWLDPPPSCAGVLAGAVNGALLNPIALTKYRLWGKACGVWGRGAPHPGAGPPRGRATGIGSMGVPVCPRHQAPWPQAAAAAAVPTAQPYAIWLRTRISPPPSPSGHAADPGAIHHPPPRGRPARGPAGGAPTPLPHLMWESCRGKSAGRGPPRLYPPNWSDSFR